MPKSCSQAFGLLEHAGCSSCFGSWQGCSVFSSAVVACASIPRDVVTSVAWQLRCP